MKKSHGGWESLLELKCPSLQLYTLTHLPNFVTGVALQARAAFSEVGIVLL